jgi:Ca-activated chloride channel family protein
MRRGSWAGILVMLAMVPGTAAGQEPEAPTFKSGVDLVTVSAVVRDRDGRLVGTLTRDDFDLVDSGVSRPITDFRTEQSPLSLGVLVDVSGSMDVTAKLEGVRQAAHHLLSWMRPGVDEAALFMFHTSLTEVVPFTKETDRIRTGLERMSPFGATSLYDATAATAERVVERGRLRRAVVVLTDGLDTASRLTPAEVSGIASAIDVPVYVLAVVSRVDNPDDELSLQEETAEQADLSDLARWTGGALIVASQPAQASLAARQIVTELRNQYLIVFEPGEKPGWHPLELRLRQRGLTVRARSGYYAGQTRPTS